MKCQKPYIGIGGAAYGCGQCRPCRINRARLWQHRCMLEATQWEHNSFVTFTYDNDHLPKDGSVNREEMRLCLDRIRKRVAPVKFRYFLVGEYGEESGRPHYHALLYNFETCRRLRTYREPGTTEPRWRECCDRCLLVGEAWARGNVDLGTCEKDSAGYVVGYVTKGMTKRDDPRLEGRKPEYAAQSLRPGLGAGAMDDLADVYLRYGLHEQHGDVHSALQYGSGATRPLGRYLVKRLRARVGMDEKTPQVTLDRMAEEMSDVRLAARASEENPSIQKRITEKYKGSAANLEVRNEMFRAKRRI